jgi:hypothetical protein
VAEQQMVMGQLQQILEFQRMEEDVFLNESKVFSKF